ncbi:MAG: tRNA pseudouridine(38-40) synthase TruA [Bacteroidota bacterium]|nr:tRNA pseudouridine(38-40) synthase TruA [Bacteroidota bacterium]
MPRYFLEVFYKGSGYSGFQAQHNANTIQAEIEKAFEILQRDKIILMASSRTDAGVHALQNYFHFDTYSLLQLRRSGRVEDAQFVYKMNAILPGDIVIKRLIPVADDAHSRFDAISRDYKYFIYRHKDPFLRDRAFYFPYQLDIDKLNQAAAIIHEYDDFTSFSKRNTQVKTFICRIIKSEWVWEDSCLVYNVRANRFLRGMVRGLTATMLKIGRGKMTLDEFHEVIRARDCTKASFSVPSHGLFLVGVEYPSGYFQ